MAKIYTSLNSDSTEIGTDFRIGNQTDSYQFTILVPLYNEEDNIAMLEEKLNSFIRLSPELFACVLFVDDGSTDRSFERITEVCNRRQHFYYINLAKNLGLSAALKAGIDVAQSEFIGYIDADLQTTPEDFNLLLPYIADYELVMGIRTKREDKFGKRISSKIANGFRRMMTHDGVTDTGCPLKIMRTSYAKRIPMFKGMHRFIPALIQLQEGKVKEVPVRHFPRIAGQSKFNLKNRLIGPFVDCFAYRWMKSRYYNYRIAKNNIEK